jgi:hypothetical protein
VDVASLGSSSLWYVPSTAAFACWGQAVDALPF